MFPIEILRAEVIIEEAFTQVRRILDRPRRRSPASSATGRPMGGDTLLVDTIAQEDALPEHAALQPDADHGTQG
jgi:hypothetical protein